MQEQNYSFAELRAELLKKLRNLGCTPITITGYRYLCNSIISWLQDNGYDFYTEDGGNAFLQDYLDNHGINQYYNNLRTTIYRLNDLTIGNWKSVHSDKGKKFFLSGEFIDVVDEYCLYEKKQRISSRYDKV